MKQGTSFNFIRTAAIAGSLAMAITGCGKSGGEKNPLKNYQAVNTAVKPHNEVLRTQYVPFNIYQIVPVGNMTFVQGQEGQVRFMTLLNLSEASKAKFVLQAEELPAGASFQREASSDFYVLSWKPANGTVGAADIKKVINVKIKFVPVKLNNPSYDFMAAQVAGKDTFIAPLTVIYDVKQPIISDTITFRPSQTVKAEQNASVLFDVTASGVRNENDLQVNTLQGPLKPARELVQLDGLIGQIERPILVNSSVDRNGNVKATFQVNFTTARFVDAVMKEIEKDAVLKKRYNDGILKVVEASFDVHVVNTYSPAKSIDKTVIIKVELPAPKLATPAPVVAPVAAAPKKAEVKK